MLFLQLIRLLIVFFPEHIYVTLNEKDTMLDLYRKVEEERETIEKNRFQLWFPDGEVFSGNNDEYTTGRANELTKKLMWKASKL